jgi:superfamily II DNA or RNA helicase
VAPVLRGYQEQMVADIRARYRAGDHRVLAVAPTGSGKTVVFSYIAAHAVRREQRVLILVHRTELLDQVSRSLHDFGTPHGVIAAGYNPRSQEAVQVASVFSLVGRLRRGLPLESTLIVVDEAHHAVSSTTWGRVLTHFPAARVLGVTATPVRLSGEGLGECFDSMVVGPSVTGLIAEGALAPFRVFCPPTIDTGGMHTRMGDFVRTELTARSDTPTVTGDAVQHYQRLAPGRAAVVFCVNIKHAEHVAEQFTAAGVSAHSVDGTMDRGLRREIVTAFTRGQLQVLTSCDLVSEGFDCPRIEVGISLRPTASVGLWLQQLGRCLRPFPGKTEALLFDHAGNVARHGLPDDDWEWSLEGRAMRRRDSDGAVSVRICPKCFAANKSGRPVCAECGAPFPAKPRQLEQQDGELVELDRQRRKKIQRQEVWQAKSYEGLVALGASRRYRFPEIWARRILEWRENKYAAANG